MMKAAIHTVPAIAKKLLYSILLFSVIHLAHAEKIGEGAGEQLADIAGTPIQLFTYRPSGCTPKAFLLVFHGVARNASTYRNAARPLADRLCMIVAAPLFDLQRFPTWRYQKGGLAHKGRIEPAASWTGHIVPKLATWLQQNEGNPALPYFLIGHSGGAQFLSRVAAVIPNQAQRIVIANPSTYVLPSTKEAPPFGLHQLPDAEGLLRRYLAQPVVILLGQEDQGSKELDESPEAQQQGSTRLDRGEQTFRKAQAVASAHGWPFNWKLLEVPGTGHSATSMFLSSQAVEALTIPEQ